MRARPPFFQLLICLLYTLCLPNSPVSGPLLGSPAPDPVVSKTLNSDPLESHRLEALHQLEKSNSLTANQLLRSITDISPNLRAEALRLAIPLVPTHPELEIRLLALAHDPAPPVRKQMLPFLASSSNPKARPLFLQLALKSVDTPSLWPLLIPPWGVDLLPALQKLCQSESWKNATHARNLFLIAAANHVREHLPLDSLETVLQMIPRANLYPRWCRVALLKGLLGQTSEAPSELAPRHKTIPFESIPKPIHELLLSKEKEFLKILEEPNPALVWPQTP